MASELTRKIFAGTLWMAALSLGQQVLAFFVQIVLARLLVPHDYGVASIVMTIGCFAVVFASAGISAAIVQRKELPHSVIDAAAVITLGGAVCLGCILFYSSSAFAAFYDIPELTLLLRIAALDIFLKVAISLYDSLMLRAMQYRSLALRTFVALIFQSIVSITLAFCGYGPLALVVGYVVGSTTQLVLCILATRYIPTSLGCWREVKGVFQFGAWVLLGRIANQLATTLDQMIIARMLNAASLGLMNVSKQLTGIVPNTFMGLVGRVTLPVFSRWQDDLKRIENAYWRGIRLNMMVVFPLCALVGIFAHQILSLLYGAKWISGVHLMRIFSLVVAIGSIDAGYAGAVLNATGKPRCLTFILMLSLPILPGCIWVGSLWGVVGAVWSLGFYSALFLLINQLVVHWQLAFSLRSLPSAIMRAFVTVIPVILLGMLFLYLDIVPTSRPPDVLSREWFVLAIQSAACAACCMAVYIFSAYCLMREDFLFLLNGVKGVFRK